MKKLYQALLCRHGTVGGGHRQRGLDNMVSPIASFGSQHDQDIIKPFYTNYDLFYYHGTVSQPEKTEDIAGGTSLDLDYQCKPTDLVMVDILPKQDILLGSISQNASINGQEKEVYFYHGDNTISNVCFRYKTERMFFC